VDEFHQRQRACQVSAPVRHVERERQTSGDSSTNRLSCKKSNTAIPPPPRRCGQRPGRFRDGQQRTRLVITRRWLSTSSELCGSVISNGGRRWNKNRDDAAAGPPADFQKKILTVCHSSENAAAAPR